MHTAATQNFLWICNIFLHTELPASCSFTTSNIANSRALPYKPNNQSQHVPSYKRAVPRKHRTVYSAWLQRSQNYTKISLEVLATSATTRVLRHCRRPLFLTTYIPSASYDCSTLFQCAPPFITELTPSHGAYFSSTVNELITKKKVLTTWRSTNFFRSFAILHTCAPHSTPMRIAINSVSTRYRHRLHVAMSARDEILSTWSEGTLNSETDVICDNGLR